MEHFKATWMIKLKDEDIETLSSCAELLYDLENELTILLNEKDDPDVRFLHEEAWRCYSNLTYFIEDCKQFGKEEK